MKVKLTCMLVNEKMRSIIEIKFYIISSTLLDDRGINKYEK